MEEEDILARICKETWKERCKGTHLTPCLIGKALRYIYSRVAIGCRAPWSAKEERGVFSLKNDSRSISPSLSRIRMRHITLLIFAWSYVYSAPLGRDTEEIRQTGVLKTVQD
jgi:hypothetical protein